MKLHSTNRKDGLFTGSDLADALEAAFQESRYPVPNPIHEKFPILGEEDAFWEPLGSSEFVGFCYEISRLILSALKSDFEIAMSESDISQVIRGEDGKRFRNVFFGNRLKAMLSE